MAVLRPVPLALVLALAAGQAWPQTVAPGSLPPPRPVQAPGQAPAPPPPPAPNRTTTPAPPPAATPARPARPAQAEPPRRPAAQPPAVGSRTPPPNRRPGNAATGAGAAAAGAAAAGAASAATRAPAPAPAPPATPPAPPPPAVGPVSGLPLPRFASLRSDQVNLRVGPNTTFPIEWTFQRRDLPVQIIGEFQVWRRVRDVDGAEGWVHQSTLAGRRTVLVRPAGGAQDIALRRHPEAESPVVARLRAGVIARVRSCEAENPWCEVQTHGYSGYVRRSDVWGLVAGEEVK